MNKTTKEFVSKRFNLKFIVLLIAITITTASCVHNGYYSIGKPRALSPTKTEASLKSQQSTVTDKTKLVSIDPFEINQGHFRSSNLSQKGKIAFAPTESGASNPSTSGVSPQEIKSSEAIAPIVGPKEYSGLVTDGFTSLESFSAHKVDIMEDFDIETMGKGSDSELYKLKFDIWVEPVRQDYWTYIWRWADIFNGFRNFTKDYHAEFHFRLKEKSNGNALCDKSKNICGKAKVILVQPVNEGINSFEAALLQKTSQLAGGGTMQGIAAELDLAERHREQFMQQRKNPVLRGLVDNDSKFHFIISPRQYIVQRTFRIPFFMSRYSIERGLESGPYPVSAYVLVKGKNVTKLPIEVCGNYKKFGNAHKSGKKDNDKIDIDEQDTGIYCKNFILDLPGDQGPKVIVSTKNPNLIHLTWGNRKFEIMEGNLTCTTNKKTAAVRLVNNGQPGNSMLKKGKLKNRDIFWIETSPAFDNKGVPVANGQKFSLEFCSNGISRQSKPVTYVAVKTYQSEISIGKDLVKGSSSGSEVKISILGVPGESIAVTKLTFGDEEATLLDKDSNSLRHILEIRAIVPREKRAKTKTVSVIATVKASSSGKSKVFPINVEQSFAIDHKVVVVAAVNTK